MFFNRPKAPRDLFQLLLSSQSFVSSLLRRHIPSILYTQNRSYVDVYMKWKKDCFFDSIEPIHKSIELGRVISLKNCFIGSPDYSIPISAISKKGLQLGIPIKVARFLRNYPSVFEEFAGPNYNLPWFRLTEEAIELHGEENDAYRKDDIMLRLKKLILMSGERRLPMKIIQGIQWYLGLPNEFLLDPENNLDGSFRVVEMEDGLKGLAVVESYEKIWSVLQRNAMERGVYNGKEGEAIAFPIFPSKGLRLKRKISDWLDGFQKLPYVSPYEDYRGMETDGDVAEKRVVGVLHELLSLFVEHAAERKKLLILRKYLGLPQKVHKAFERHPHLFYLSLRNKTCTVILKEAYRDKSSMDAHPLAEVRKKYIALMKASEVMLRSRRQNTGSSDQSNVKLIKDLDCSDDEKVEMEEVPLFV